MVAVRGYERPARKDFCSPFVVEGAAWGWWRSLSGCGTLKLSLTGDHLSLYLLIPLGAERTARYSEAPGSLGSLASCLFETGSHCIALPGLELIDIATSAFPGARIKSVCHLARLQGWFWTPAPLCLHLSGPLQCGTTPHSKVWVFLCPCVIASHSWLAIWTKSTW